MGWKDSLQSARDLGQKSLDARTHAVIEEHWPKIQQLFREQVGPAALAAAHDDQKFESVCKLVYAVLPFPVHLAVKEDAFVKFCFAHRESLAPAAADAVGGAI